jgi:hypothetical protein
VDKYGDSSYSDDVFFHIANVEIARGKINKASGPAISVACGKDGHTSVVEIELIPSARYVLVSPYQEFGACYLQKSFQIFGIKGFCSSSAGPIAFVQRVVPQNLHPQRIGGPYSGKVVYI